MFTDVTRQSDGRRYADVGVYSSVWSNMVYSYGITSCASGWIQYGTNAWTPTQVVCG